MSIIRLAQCGFCVAMTAAMITLPFLLKQDNELEQQAPAFLESIEPSILGKQYPQIDLPFSSVPVGALPRHLPLISHIQVRDINNNGLNDVVVCDIQAHRIFAYEHTQNGQFQERILCRGLSAPAHCTFVDIDADGDEDILVAELGDVFPNDGHIGQILLYLNNNGSYERQVILKQLRRIADIQAADFDADGDLDLVVAEFGHFRGSVFYLEQTAPMTFKRRDLLLGPGAIHVPIADYDNDGDLDIATVLSQDEEEVCLLLNNGSGNFKKQLIFNTVNFDFGSGGLVSSDIDADGDVDLLIPAGDNLERETQFPRAYHGCYLLENNFKQESKLSFTSKRISDLPGCYAVTVGDLDHDSDLDLVLVSMSNDYADEHSASVVALIQDDGGFTTQQIAARPIRLISTAIGDINNDGLSDVLAGALRIHPPYVHVARLQAWIQQRQRAGE